MKKILVATAVALALSATAANAASTAVLKVTGLLSVAACTPQLSGGGEVDYGLIHLADLSATSVNQLGQKDISLTITCPVATKAGWTISDDRADTHPGASVITINTADAAGGNVSDTTQSYGVGKTAGGVKIGAYSIFADVANVTADGVKSDVISGTVDSPSAENRYRYHQKRQHGNDDRGRFRHHCAAAFHDRSISAENLSGDSEYRGPRDYR